MAKSIEKKESHLDLITCLCHWENSIFIGILLFIMGLLRWAVEARFVAPEMFWVDALMIMGILFAMKGAFFSVIKQ